MDPAVQVVLDQLQAEVQTLQAAAAAAAATNAAAGLAQAPPAAPVFTLAPALVNTAVFLDLTSVSGTKHFKGATEPLNKQPFDFTDSSDLQVFLDLVLKKFQVWGWNTIFTIPVTNPLTGITTNHNLLDEYGLIPLASVTFDALGCANMHTKVAQDLSCCFSASLPHLAWDF